MTVPINAHSPGLKTVIVSAIFTALAFIIVSLRLYTRLRVVHTPGVEDAIIVAALLASIGVTICWIFQVEYGQGVHISTLDMHTVETFVKILFIAICFYNSALSLTKVSILMQYLRVFVNTRLRIVFKVIMSVVIGYCLFAILSTVFMCHPIERFWDSSVPGKCLNVTALWFSNATVNIVTDLAIFSTPLPYLSTLQLPKKQKFCLYALFALGFFTCIVSIIRLYQLHVITISKDVTFDNVAIAIWTSVEANTGIMCACGPALKPLIVRLFPSLTERSAQDSITLNDSQIQPMDTLPKPEAGCCGGMRNKKDCDLHDCKDEYHNHIKVTPFGSENNSSKAQDQV